MTNPPEKTEKNENNGNAEERNDRNVKIAELKEVARRFAADRGWEIYHQPKNLAMSVAIEAAELMELFQWLTPEEAEELTENHQKRVALGEEIADVFSYLLLLCHRTGIDLTDAYLKKVAKNGEKYPVTEFYGVYGYDDPKREKK